MRRIFAAAVAVVFLTACSTEIRPDTAASDAAREYYEMLLGGEYDGFVAGMNFPDSIPASYREQLVANAKMFMAQQKDEHKGIVGLQILRQQRDSLAPEANVFMLITYADSIKEEIVVPMVERDGKWYMR